MLQSDPEEELRNLVHKVSSNYDDGYWREIYLERKFPSEYWDSLARAGLFGSMIRKEWGGLGRSFRELVAAAEETAEFSAGMASYLFFSGSLVSQFFERAGTARQKEEFLPKLARGQVRFSVALSEESSGLDALSCKTSAIRISSNTFEIMGSKRFVANVDRANYLILFARTRPPDSNSKKSSGISIFLVDPTDSAIKSIPHEKAGLDFMNVFSLEITRLKADSDQIIGEVDHGWKDAAPIFEADRLLTAAALIGTGKLALRKASEHARDRKVFGRTIGSNQGIQFPLAGAAADLISAANLVEKAAELLEQDRRLVNSALLQSIYAASQATDASFQTFGGHGYEKQADVERYWRDVRAFRLHPISEELLMSSIAEKILNLPRSF